MTPEDYAGRSNAIELEMKRIRGILDGAALAKARYGIEPNPNLISKAHADLDKALKEWKKLDEDFWGS